MSLTTETSFGRTGLLTQQANLGHFEELIGWLNETIYTQK